MPSSMSQGTIGPQRDPDRDLAADAVLGPVSELEADGELQAEPVPLEVEALDLVGLHGVEHRPGHGLLGRDVHPLRLAGLLHAALRQQRGDRGLRAGMAPGLGHRHLDRRPLGDALQAHRPTQRGEGQLRGGLVGARSVDAERRDEDVDETVVGGHQVGLGDPRVGQRTGRAGLEDDVGAGDQVEQRAPVGLGGEVQDDRALAGVVGGELQAAQILRAVRAQRVLAPGRRTAGRLDPEHLGAEPAQQPRTDLTPVVGQVEYSQVGQQQALTGAVAGCVGFHGRAPPRCRDRDRRTSSTAEWSGSDGQAQRR